jgi:hypothetical protein
VGELNITRTFDLRVVRGTAAGVVHRVARVVGGAVKDRRVGARNAEVPGGCQSGRVGLRLEVPLVHEPVAHIENEDDEEHQDGQPQGDHDEHAARLSVDRIGPRDHEEHPAP